MPKPTHHKISFSDKTFLTASSRLNILVKCLDFVIAPSNKNTPFDLTIHQQEAVDKCKVKVKKLNSIVISIGTQKKQLKLSAQQFKEKEREFYNILNYVSGVADTLMLGISEDEF